MNQGAQDESSMTKYTAKCPCGWERNSDKIDAVDQAAHKHARLSSHKPVMIVANDGSALPAAIN